MGWSVDEVRRRREALEKEDASKKAAAAAKASTNTKAAGTAKSGGSTGVTAGAPLATGLSTVKAGTSAKTTGPAKSGGTAGGKKTTTTATPSLGTRVLAQMDGTQTAAATAKTGKKLPTVQRQNQPEWLQTESGTPAAVVRGANESQKAAQRRRNGSEGVLAQGAQAIKDHTAKAEDEDKFSDFTRLNRWMDADPKHRTLVSLIRMGKSGVEDAAALGSSTGDNAVKAQKPYTDAELIAKGYSQWQIDEARQYIAEYDELPAAEKAVRRSADTWKGIGGAVASFSPQLGENLGTAIWNTWSTNANERALDKSLAGDERAKQLKDMITAVDMDYKPQYTDEQLRAMGYSQSEITGMRQKVAGTVTNESVDRDESVGYQLYDYGRKRTERATAGMNETAKTAMGIATSAAENLAVAGISPALVLPVLSAQGGAEAMGQSIDKGESAGKTLVGGLAKFGAGWAINSVGAADLARTMGSDYAKDTLAGKLADVVRSVADNGVLAQQYPTVANAISGGIDNAMQAFVETYADKAIDAALGDEQAAQELFNRDTFLTALESGLTGGASGALGGAVGTQLGRMSAALEAEGQTGQRNGPSPSAQGADSSPEREALGGELPQSPAGDSSLREGALGTAAQKAEQTAVNDDPAVHTPAQNASIEEYKQSVDPGLAEYVDRVRAGEDLAPYTVTETSDRMRDAMQQLTGLDKVGKVTMMDANAVKHITNRHAGGDGSADGTMKESADVARAAYVLNHFDNAYLATRKADGYYTGSRKKAPIVIFEKKIDGSHIVVEAVCDTKKSKNFIVSEYLSSVGVPEKEIAKALQPSMDAVADPRDTSGTLSADTSADTTVSQQAGDVNGQRVENAGETVETPAVSHSLDSSLGEGAFAQQAEPTALRETAGLEVRSEGAQKSSVQRELLRWKVSEGAAQTLSRNMPTGIADESRYAAAASSLYRLGQMEDVTTFDKAMELAKGMNGLAVNTDYVLAQPGGEAALKIAWLQGKGEAEAGAVQTGTPGGALSAKSVSGSGRVLYKGTMRTADEVATKLIELNARATDTDAVLKAVLEGDERVKAYVDTAAGQIFFADSAGDIFGTVLHEDWHWYNALDAEGAKAVQQHVLEYLAKSEGFENIDDLIRAKLTDYAQQNLTYGEAAEELVADAWRGIFDSEESFKRWVEFQRGQAEKNAGRAGTIRKVMNAVKNLLTDIVSRAKEVLANDPENKAALKAQRLAEAEKRALQEEYFAHAEKAMDALRAAKENAAALKSEGAAQGVRFQLHEGKDSLVEQMNGHLDELEEMKPVATIEGTEVSFGKTRNENISNVEEFFDSIGNKVIRENFGTVELTKSGARATVQHGNSKAKQVAVAAVPEVIQKGKQIGYEQNWQGRGYDTYVFAAPVEIDGTKLYEGVIVREYTRQNGMKNFYVHEVCWTDGSYVTFDTEGNMTKKEDTPTQLPKAVRSTLADAQEVSSDTTIAQTSAKSKENNAAVQKNVRYQLAEQASRDAKRNEQQQASRVIAEKAAALDTLSQFFGLTKGVNVSRSAVDELAGRWLKANGSKADRAKLAQETEVLVNYLKADGADMNKAEALAETLAGEIQDGAMYRNSELWDEYPELHKLEYTVNKSGQAKAELVKRYGSWSEAVAEARRHGVTLRQAEGVRDGNPAEQYESLVNDDRAVGGVTDGAKALWKQAAEQAGVAGSLSFESTEWLDVLMNLHDAIKPKTMSRFADKAEYEDARMELAGRIIGDIMQLPQLTDAEAIFEGIQRHNLEAAKAAAGDAARAAEVEKGLRGVQKVQSREFNRRLAENQRTAGRNAEVQHVSELQKRNAKAEKQLDANLELLGVDVSNVGDLNEKLTVLRETYEREWKAERKRMRTELQQMRDEARLEVRQLRGENADLARQVRDEQRRADKAEYSLIVQENEIMEWEEENQRKAEAWQQKQAQRNALAAEVARQQRDEEIAIAKRVAEKRVQKARDGRKMDELKRGIRQDAAALNQMVLRPSKGKYVSQRLIKQAVEVAKIADMIVLNDQAVARLTRLQNSIKASMGSKGSPTAMTTEWEQTGVPDLITELQNDLTAWKDAKLADLQAKLAEAEALPYSEKALALQERLRKRIRETESRTYLPMTVDQMRMLKTITSATLHVIRNENKTVSLAKAEEVSKIADEAAYEVTLSKGNHPGGALDGLQNLLTKYNLDMLGAERVLRMLGGYKNGGQMEKIGQMLNDGQYRQTKITIEGEKLFADVTGAKHAEEAQAFAGPGADLVDVGLRDTDHNAVPLTHAQLCSLYMHLQNKDSREHLMTGGMVVPDAQLYSKGDVEQAYQKGQLVQLGMLSDGHGEAMADTILNTLEAAMTDYDRAWCADMKEFFGTYTTKLINETSLQLVGYKRATVQNYYPIAVDKAALATEIDGVKLDATIEGRGFLKNRVKSSKPILLEECSSVVQRSLRDTAAYAGLAAPIRDVQKILNAGVETRDGVKTLKNGVIKEQWGTKAVSYLDDLLTDLQTTQRHRSNGVSRMLSTLRGNYAGAVLTLNPGVAIAQAASLPTAAAVLGGDTMASVMPFVKNLSPKQKAALEAEIAQHGDVLLQWRQRGTGKGELQSIGKRETLVQKGMDKVPGWLTGWINGMDEITVAALWEGSKAYVKNHAAEFEGAGETGSPAYWEAVNRTYQKVIEQTQPNYTVMQRAGIQRNPDEMVKTFTMFTTQRFQNAGILIDAVGDWKAQAARYKADASDANKAELQRATKQRDRAILSQAAQVAVFAMMKIGADFLLHRWDREQDENGDVTLKSMVSRFFSLSTESTMGNFLFGSELYSLIDNAIEGKDYDVISATNISAVNDMASDVVKFTAELKKDTSEMDEAELEKHHKKLMEKGMALIENGFEIVGVPYGNGRKMVDAVRGYWDDAQNVAQGGKFSFNSLPESATGQYDRLYNAYASGDADEAQAAVEKLVAMGKEGEIYKQLKTRLKKYDADTRAAAKAQMEGNEAERYRLETETIEALYDVLGIRKNVKEDAPKREAVIDCVTGAVNALETEMLKGDAGDMYADLGEAVDSRKAQDVQAEYDRLMKAGRTPSSVKSKLTELAKPEYLAGSDADKQQLADVLLALTDTDGNALYTEKTFAQWEKAAEKATQAEPEEDPYALLR